MFKHCSDIFFDLDHTLWDFEKNSAISFRLVFDEMDFNVSLDDFQKVYQPINFDYWKLYRDNKISKETLRYGRLKDAFDLMNLQVSDEQINQISEGYIRYLSHQVHLFPGAVDILNYLNVNYRLHIITNGFSEAQLNKTKASKIDHFFECFIDSEQVGVKKPHPDIFKFALDKAKVRPEQSVMIGDNLEADILGAKA
ncbi:MAG: noncanonical pyrimidine nucleotidase, YjjG family, partial [Flavobacteriaceae bacterium]|nr:noncanonical pyrimidine nucleotidase, YjjG family [Flavobacteriaceae bacterium]